MKLSQFRRIIREEVSSVLRELNKAPYVEVLYDKPFDTTTIQGVSRDGHFRAITVKGNYELEWKKKYNDIDAAIRNIESGLVKYKIIDIFK
jgi:hypothetical protein